MTYVAPGGGNIAQFDFEMLTGSQASLYFGPSSRTTVGDASFSDVDPLHLTAIDAFDANGNPLDVQFSFASGANYGLGPSTSTVPEPSELALFASGFAGLGVVVRRRRP